MVKNVAKDTEVNLKVNSGNAATELKDVGNAADKASESVENLGLTYNVANQIFQKSIELIGNMIEQYAELDAATTEFRKVSSLSGEALDEYVSKLGQMGSEVARTTSQMVEGATEFKKSGFSDEDAAQLALVSAQLQNVADEELSAGEAANFLVSQIQAFNYTADDAAHIVDALNETSNRFAVSSGDLTKALPLVSAALSVGNNSMEEMIGLTVGAVEITRNASKAARGLVSVQSRLNQVVDESSSTGKNLTAWYEEHNIAIYDQEGQLMSLYDVLSQVADIWPTLTTNEKDYYLNQQAGANQTVQLASILSNFDHVLEATATAEDSAGSAARENAAYMESWEAKNIGLSERICGKPLRALPTCKGNDRAIVTTVRIGQSAGKKQMLCPQRLSCKGVGSSDLQVFRHRNVKI